LSEEDIMGEDELLARVPLLKRKSDCPILESFSMKGEGRKLTTFKKGPRNILQFGVKLSNSVVLKSL
jgi:hypothetical protein